MELKSINFLSSNLPLDSSPRSRRTEEVILVAVEASPVGSKPPAAVGERISKDGTRPGCGIAALDHDVIPTRESGRFGLHAETGRVRVWAGFNPASRKAIPTHCLYCCSGALRALVSLGVCVPVCLHGKTWLSSAILQACQTLIDTRPFLYIFFHLIQNFVQLPVPSIESFFHHSIYILHRGLARPEFFLLEDEAIALGDSLTLLPCHVRETSALRALVC